MPTKICFKCKETKDIDDFYKHPAMLDGHLGKCKECARKDSTNWRWGKVDEIREYDRTRDHRHRDNQYTRKYRRDNPEKWAAAQIVNNSIRSGKIEKPDRCSICGTMGRIEAHHNDYTKPLEIVWACSLCHHALHQKEPQLSMAV